MAGQIGKMFGSPGRADTFRSCGHGPEGSGRAPAIALSMTAAFGGGQTDTPDQNRATGRTARVFPRRRAGYQAFQATAFWLCSPSPSMPSVIVWPSFR